MKHIYGITVARKKDKQGKEDKVSSQKFINNFTLFICNEVHFLLHLKIFGLFFLTLSTNMSHVHIVDDKSTNHCTSQFIWVSTMSYYHRPIFSNTLFPL
jgi:hypothetical protein